MSWSSSTLGEVVERDGGLIQTGPFGSQLHQSDYVSEGIPVIMPKDIADGQVDPESVARVSEETAIRLSRHQLQSRTIVLPRRGEITKRAFIREDQTGWLCGTGCLQIALDGKHLLPEFLYYYMEQQAVVRWLEQHAVGTTMLNLSATIVSDLPVMYPTLASQRCIAGILSAYDDLIENNRRRMALLEEAAGQLYREWFVCLRFPGHEHTRITNGVPEGWREVRLEEALVDLESGGRPRGGAKDADGIPSIGAENVLGIGQYDYSKEKFVPEDYFEKMTRGVVRNRDVVLYKDGANIGRASYFGEGFPYDKCAVNEHVFILRTQPFLGQSFLYFWMIRDENRQAIANLNANTAQPGINQEKLKGLRFLLPSERLTRAFNEAVELQVKQIFALALMNRRLCCARDLLLPRLMSGEIAV